MSPPTLVGRTRELAELEGIVERSRRGERAVAFVGGDAGIGKTRLVTAVAERARAGDVEVLLGGCLDLDAGGVPYAPVVEALADLVERLGPDEAEGALGPEAEHLGPALAVGGRADELTGQTATLQAVRRVLAHLARRRPVLLIVEDAHWADRSTRDLIAFLAGAPSPTPVALIVTYRRDDLHRGHPLRPLLAELARRPHVEHLGLEPLGRADASALLAAVLGAPVDPALAEAIYRRAEGNPFFLEELARAGAGASGEVPSIVSEVMTARVAQLSPNAQEVLRAAAVGGRRVTHDRLAAVVAVDEHDLAAALREAQAANLVTVEPERRRYEFRHALLHEAVYRDVLPGERRRYHTSYAEQLTAERAGARGPAGIEDLAELAHHWRGADRWDEALTATLAAAAAAEAAYAMPEAHRYYELALQLWEPDDQSDGLAAVHAPTGRPTDRVGPADGERPLRRDVLLRAADAASRTGAFARAVELVTTAIDELDPDADPTAAGLLHERRAWFLWRAGREDAAVIEYREAVRLVPATPRSAARARVLAAYADALERGGTPDEARPWADEAVAIAREVGSPFDEGHARHALGVALEAAGDTDGALAELHLARELAERNGDVADVAGTYLHLWRILSEHGRGDEMVALAVSAADLCRAAELDVAALLLDCLAAGFLHQLGRWDEAEARLPVDDADVWGLPAVVVRVVSGLLAVDRGQLDEAEEHLETARALGAQIHDGRINGLLARGRTELALWRGRPDEAAAAAADGLRLTSDDEMRARLCWLGLRAAADVAEQQRATTGMWDARPEAAELARLLGRLEERAQGRRAPPASEVRAAVAAGEAERGRLEGRAEPERWAEAARRWDGLGFPAPAGYCRWRQAAAELAGGRRAQALPLWRSSWQGAADLGADGLREAIEADAARAAVPLAGEGAAAVDAAAVPFGLTARELEVLALVAAGRTNRQIGERLFISEKTASVHVSRILAKLGARSRAQAAAMAGTVGLVGPAPAAPTPRPGPPDGTGGRDAGPK
jgi:DNA-binding CsgD family transcriptional regulator/tetratricopeptide (TPR) repeat protein